MNIPLINKQGLINLGYGHCTTERIIKQTKAQLVEEGITFYDNKRLGLVPVITVEGMLGIKIPLELEGVC